MPSLKPRPRPNAKTPPSKSKGKSASSFSQRSEAKSAGTTNSSGGTIDTDTAVAQLRRANLPSKVRGLTTKSFGKKGADLLAYLASPAYANDLAEGKGICLTGDASIRSDMFSLMAKGLALADRAVWFCTVHYLVSILDHGSEEDRAKLVRVGTLFVDWFEKDFGTDACPYTFAQRADVEEFLSNRLRAGNITHFSAWSDWSSLRWWSRDFLAQFKTNIVDIKI